MSDPAKFLEAIKNGYTFKGEAYKIGCGMLDGNVVSGADVFIPMKTLNRHGLIAGATGTGAAAGTREDHDLHHGKLPGDVSHEARLACQPRSRRPRFLWY